MDFFENIPADEEDKNELFNKCGTKAQGKKVETNKLEERLQCDQCDKRRVRHSSRIASRADG